MQVTALHWIRQCRASWQICARMAKINHVWLTACPTRSVMPEVGSESTQSASSCLPHTHMHQNGKNQSWLAHSMLRQVSHAWNGLWESTQSASSCLPSHTNMYQNGENQSCLAHKLQYAPAGQSCLKWAQKAPTVPSAACNTPSYARRDMFLMVGWCTWKNLIAD
jgi:hypothetical protein